MGEEEKMNTVSRSQDSGRPSADAEVTARLDALPSAAVRAANIIRYLECAQVRDLRADDGHGYRTTRQIAQVLGESLEATRGLLDDMADAGRVRRDACANGIFWRSSTPLPWEPGGAVAVRRAEEEAAWKQPLTLLVQAVSVERGQTVSRDVKAYPAALRDRAEAHVRGANAEAKVRLDSDRNDYRHLNAGYVAPPTYRLVETLTVAALSKVEGR